MGTLELGHDPQYGEQEAQVRSHRCLKQDFPVDQFLDLRVESVDDLLAIEKNLQDLIITGQKRLGRPGQVLGDQGEQFDDLGLDGLEVVLKFLPALAHAKSLLGSELAYQAADPLVIRHAHHDWPEVIPGVRRSFT